MTFGVSCTQKFTYTPPKIEPVKKYEHYNVPADPFANVEPPVPIFLCKNGGGVDKDGNKFDSYRSCEKALSTVIAYVPREHDKIVLRIGYYKELVPALVRLVNVYIEIANVKGELINDQMLAKEVYKQMWVDTENKRISEADKAMLEKFGLLGLSIAQVIAILALAL